MALKIIIIIVIIIQTKYLYRHNAALKILFFEFLREHGLIEEVPPWYSTGDAKTSLPEHHE